MRKRGSPPSRSGPKNTPELTVIRQAFGELRCAAKAAGIDLHEIDESFRKEAEARGMKAEEATVRSWRESEVELTICADPEGIEVSLTVQDERCQELWNSEVAYNKGREGWQWVFSLYIYSELDLHPRIGGECIDLPKSKEIISMEEAMRIAKLLILFYSQLPLLPPLIERIFPH